MPKIFILSDGTGQTAHQAVEAALTQFRGTNPEISRFGEVRTIDRIHKIILKAKEEDAFLIHTLVKDKLREELVRFARVHNIESIDLMGPLLHRLTDHLSANPSEKPGLFRVLNDSYFRKIETMQFAFKHDDGKKVEELEKAEIVLLGVSRTFKTPLSIYLAFRGWYVANIPIILDIPLPDEVYEMPDEKVFCLTTYPTRLALLRKARVEKLGGTSGDYANPEYVRKEINYANRIFDLHPGWQKINVTSKAIEEISSEIIALLSQKKDRNNEMDLNNQ
jgi:hypothetical protein